ncbi:hypothetical protein [Lysobacter sp. A3-1-A15]|uniref:hypothetical protein n=1 Tax=Novilysobacter viscosus TaxID=3098602 RepID=UPI002EDA76EE
MTAYSVIVALHVTFGTVALATFWLAAVLRKGGRAHVLAGRGYLLAMCGVLLSALPMVGQRVADGRWVAAVFLGYLVVLVATTVWLAWRAVRDKAAPQRYLGGVYRVLMVANPVAGAVVLATGVSMGQPLLMGFSLVGLMIGVDMWRRRRVIPAQPRWWMQEHYGAMVGNGAATHIAFLAIGLPRLLPDIASGTLFYTAWFAPVVLSIAAKSWLDRKYRFTGPQAAMPRAARA